MRIEASEREDDLGNFTSSITVQSSQVVVAITSSWEGSFLELKNIAVSQAASHVDALGFESGAALRVEMYIHISPDGHIHVLSTGFDGLRDADISVEGVVNLSRAAFEVTGVDTALADIRRAIAHPSDTVWYSFRAVEAIRQGYATDDDSASARKRSWVSMRETTGVSEQDLKWLTDLATPRRHGAWVAQSEDVRRRSIRIARSVVTGFLRAKTETKEEAIQSQT